MATFAQIDLDPVGVVAWVIAGLSAGLLAGRLMAGGGYGLVGDLVAGLVGAVACGSSFAMFVAGTSGLVGSIVAACLGACLLIWFQRTAAPGRGQPLVTARGPAPRRGP
jgi:uncharacterized membrane protein YeaQ/YmgE (transglycosylase-associated protein family)